MQGLLVEVVGCNGFHSRKAQGFAAVQRGHLIFRLSLMALHQE